MAQYNNFNQVLRDRKLNQQAKRAFVTRWLRETYTVEYVSNESFFDELTRVHDHDGQPLHFGRVPLVTDIGGVLVQLVRNQGSNDWRIAITFDAASEEHPIILGAVDGRETGDLDEANLAAFKSLLTAPNTVGTAPASGRFGALDEAMDEQTDLAAPHTASSHPYAIPAELYDATWVPGIQGRTNAADASLNADFEAVVARFMAASA